MNRKSESKRRSTVESSPRRKRKNKFKTVTLDMVKGVKDTIAKVSKDMAQYRIPNFGENRYVNDRLDQYRF